MKAITDKVPADKRSCILIHDEVYVKKMMLYHGGRIFGRAQNDPAALAKTLLGMMLIFLYGGPKFLTKMIPVSNLTSEFLFNQVHVTLSTLLELCSTLVKAIVCDGNRVNQQFFKMFMTSPGKPWLTKSGTYLLFDYVHLLKNIRNLWLTEKTQELQFPHGGKLCTAIWSHLVQLHSYEQGKIAKTSDLDAVSIAPKPIERQRVSTVLKVFSEKTHAALISCTQIDNSRLETAAFIHKVLTWWTIINVRSRGKDVKHRNPLQKEILSPSDDRLDTILEFGDMAMQMHKKGNGPRIKQLSIDTANAIFHTCRGLVDLCRDLLASTYDYVLLGLFSSDALEKEFGKLRQGSGGTYFINVRQCVEKLHIQQTSLLLKEGVDIDSLGVSSGHKCDSCAYTLTEEGSEVFDNLETLENSIPDETKAALVYITGYVTRRDDEMNDQESTHFYFDKYGSYQKILDRGGLKIPQDNACQWCFFCYALFLTVKDDVCRKSLSSLFMLISEYHFFEMEERHCFTLSNIFFNNLCKLVTPRSNKEPALKILKLS